MTSASSVAAHVDHMSLFSPVEAAAPVTPAHVGRYRSKYQSSSSGSGSTHFTPDSDLSSIQTPPFHLNDSSLVISKPGIVSSQYVVKTVETMMFDSYTQVSEECQDSGKGRFGLPYALIKVGIYTPELISVSVFIFI